MSRTNNSNEFVSSGGSSQFRHYLVIDPLFINLWIFIIIHHKVISNKVSVAISDNNIYSAWGSNKTGNDEVMFRASTDAGKTFGDKINLSNTTNSESQDIEIAADGAKVVVTWWERNQTSNEPVMITSDDGGKTFGPLLKLATNGTISTGEVKPLI